MNNTQYNFVSFANISQFIAPITFEGICNWPLIIVCTRNTIYDVTKSVGIKERIGTHTLRKTFGYHAYNNGYDITLIQKLFNHSSPAVTLRYIGITQDEIQDLFHNRITVINEGELVEFGTPEELINIEHMNKIDLEKWHFINKG